MLLLASVCASEIDFTRVGNVYRVIAQTPSTTYPISQKCATVLLEYDETNSSFYITRRYLDVNSVQEPEYKVLNYKGNF